MKRTKVNTPSKLSYRLDNFIDCKIMDIVSMSGTTKTQVVRAFFNFGLNYFFAKGKVKNISDQEWSKLLNSAQLNKVVYKLSDPQNCTLTKIQECDLGKIGIIEFTGKGQAIRLIFHIGIAEFDYIFNAKIKSYKECHSKINDEMLCDHKFDVSRDLIHLNCFDKV